MKKLIIILFSVLIVGAGVYYYIGTLKPDLIIFSETEVNKSSSRVTVLTVKNVGKTTVNGPVYICILDTGSQKYIKSGGKDLTCGHVALVNLDTGVVNGEIKPIGINESVTLPITLDGYFGPLVVMVDRTNKNDIDNLVKESKEYNNSVYLYASDKGWVMQGEI